MKVKKSYPSLGVLTLATFLAYSASASAQSSTVADLTVTNSLDSLQGLQVNGVTIVDGLGNVTANSGSYSGTVNATQGILVNGIAVVNQGRKIQNITGITSSGAISTTGSFQINGTTVIDYARNLAAVNGNFSGTVSMAGLLSANGGVMTTTLNSTQGIQVGGTTVIDANRNLLNIASLSTSGAINTATGYQVAGVSVIDAQRNLSAANGEFSGALTVAGALNAAGGVSTSNLNTTGNATIGGSVTAGNLVNATNGFQVNGTGVIDANRNLVNIGSINASGNVNTTGNYQVAGVTVIDAQRNLHAVNGDFSGNLAIAGLLTANGGINTTTLAASGNATVGGTLSVGDTVNAVNGYQVAGTAVIDGNRNLVNIGSITANGNINTTGNYQVAGVTVIDAQRNLMAVNGVFSGALTANGGINTNSLMVSGATTLAGGLTLGGTRTYLSGFDANNQHWIALSNGAEPAALFLGFEKGSNGAGRMIANVPVHLSDGTASNPALGFNTAQGTGIFSPSSNSIGLSTAGVEHLRIGSDGVTKIGNLNGNYLQIAANGTSARLSAQGTANDIALYLSAKGNGYIVAQSVLTFDSSVQSSEGVSCPQVGAITTDTNGDILTCK